MHLGLAEWVVLAVVAERPSHGFAVASQTATDGDLGRIWHIPRPLVYRALTRLEQAGLVLASAAESGPGPIRTPYSASAAGQRAALDWLDSPVPHVRELRSQFLLKLALHERRRSTPNVLLHRQHDTLVPTVEALQDSHRQATGFDSVLLGWRLSLAQASLRFIEELLDEAASHTARQRG